jgi:hypothetical protein
MEAKLAEVWQRLGARLGLREAEIREALWYYYFDVDQSPVAWLAGLFFQRGVSPEPSNPCFLEFYSLRSLPLKQYVR